MKFKIYVDLIVDCFFFVEASDYEEAEKEALQLLHTGKANLSMPNEPALYTNIKVEKLK